MSWLLICWFDVICATAVTFVLPFEMFNINLGHILAAHKVQQVYKMAEDKVSPNTASWFPQCYEISDGSQDARRGSSDMAN